MSAPAPALGWTPRDGETVHLNPRNGWQLPAGRYKLNRGPNGWTLAGVTNSAARRVGAAQLIGAEVAGTLTAIGEGELAREAEEVRLRLNAPLQQRRAGRWTRQHDASDLALFRTASEPGLGL